MHLKKIFIQGFKSFADKTEIEFNNGITAIVGPNGSGKSNVADAVRWVLGEQSVKVLRGSKMEDIIFSGTEKRKPLGYAEVTITFDNSDGTIPVDYQEVAITRRMFRSGESEYYLNKHSCRLKDIRELFMDTGIGKDGYSIIGQGRIDEILSSRPEDRRNIFEEAAGIVKYKVKKSEAEKKLEITDDNLVRIKDIIAELKSQYDSLKDQSEKATYFLELSNRVKEIEVNLLVRKVNELKDELEIIEDEKKKVQEQINQAITEKKQVEDRLNSIKVEIEDKDSKIEALQKDRDSISNLLSDKKSELSLLEEKKKFYIKDTERLIKEIEDLNIKLNKLRSEREVLLEISSTKEEELNFNKEDFNEKIIKLEQLNEKIKTKEKDIQAGRNKFVELYNLITEKKSAINSILSFKENIYKRIEQIEKDIDFLLKKKEENKCLIDKYQKEELIKKDEVINGNKYLVSLELQEKEYKEELNRTYASINQNKVDLQGMIANYNLLKNMEDDYEGYYKGVKNLMIAHKKDSILKDRLIGVVADLIKVEEKYEKAIEIALGSSLQNVVTKDEDDAKYVINYLREKKLGRVTFLPLTTIKGKAINISPKDREENNIIGLGSELIVYDNKYKNIIEYLLGRTIVVEDLDDATIVAKKFDYSFMVVTLKGDIINSGGSMTGGSLPKVNNLINRKYRIEKIKEEINRLSKAQEELEQKKNNLESLIGDYNRKIREQQDKLQSSNIELVKIENEINKFKLELNKSDESILKYKNEISELNSQLVSISEDESKLNEEIATINRENDIIKQKVEKLTVEYEEDKKILEEAQNEVTNAKIQINIMENKIVNNREKLESTAKDLIDVTESIEKKKKEIDDIKANIESLDNNYLLIKDEIDKLINKKTEIEEKISSLKEKKDLLMNDFYQIQHKLNEVNENINIIEKTQNSWNIKETKYNVQLDNIYKKLLEEYELSYEQAIEYWLELDNLKEAEKELVKLKNCIRDLGTINLNSIEEFKLVKERLEFLTQQHKDLLNAKENLEKVISDMESNMKKQFLLKFSAINKQFSIVFSKLFDGGKAELIIENEDDLLNCGIEIKVQPPGKKLQNINLLSGGEKSLTAVALLFAILNIKPTPFCILDEIDAALDDANINRYTDYLMNLSKDTQFIMITHRKGTMEIADALYGITMEEDGISKMISVKLTDNQGEIAS